MAKLAVLALSFVLTGTAFAQASATVGSDSGVAGETVVIPVQYVAGSDIGGVEIDVQFTAAQYSAVTLDCSVQTVGASLDFCDDSGSGFVAIKLARIDLNPLTSGLLANISFTIDAGATPGAEALDAVFVAASDTLGNDLGEGSITLNDGVLTIQGPAYTSNPPPGALDLGSVIQNDTDPMVSVDITNTGAAGTTLTGTCSETADPSGVFTVGGTTNFSVLQGDPADTVTVTCDSAGPIAVHTGTMECTHNGDNIASPAVYNLSCTITAGPQPAYSSNPAPDAVINLGPTEQGDPDPSANIQITNNGDPNTTLTGTCGVTGDAEISVADGAFSLAQGASEIQVVSCDASAQGMYSATVSCEHNGSNASPASYTVNCEITPPGAAIFASDPAPGVIDMTPGDDPPAGSANPMSPLTFFNNAEVGDNDLGISCTLVGDPEITVAPDISGGIAIAPTASSAVTFTCDATNVGNYSATYSCPYDTDGVEGDDGQADYTVNCDIRDAESNVDASPPSGTPLNNLADPGGSADFNVTFTEVNDEGVDGSVSCSLADGTNFAITAPASFPAAVPAGGSLVVTVTGTDPDDGSTSISDTLNCTYSDSAGDTDVSYPLTLQIGGGVVIEVTKAYTEGYDGDVTVFLTCDTGLPLQQQFDISPGNPVFFVVTNFESGAMDCSVTEGSGNGFDPTYVASGDSASVDDDPDAPGCTFLDIAGGDRNLCEITNEPAPVDVVIEKDWVVSGAVGEEVNDYFFLTLYCDSEIIGGSMSYQVPSVKSANGLIVLPSEWYKTFEGAGDSIFTAEVVPSFPTTNCWVEESIYSSEIEVDNGCTDIEVSLNQGDSCLITNTVFFEGIPTLSQWGMMLMALLMLGVGMVGLRRFV